MRLDELRSLVNAMTKRPCRIELDRNDQHNIHAGDLWVALLPHQCVTSIEREQERNASAVAALANHADALLDLVAAVAQRLEARCWSLGPQDPLGSRLCWCGDQKATDGCPITKADLAIYACYRELEAVPNE